MSFHSNRFARDRTESPAATDAACLASRKRLLQKSEINLGREGTSQAANFPELRNEIVALKKLEQEQKEVALRIAQIEEGIKKIEADRQKNAREQAEAIAKLEMEKRPILQLRDEAKRAAEICDRELSAVDHRIQNNDDADRDLLKQLSELQALTPPPADVESRSATISQPTRATCRKSGRNLFARAWAAPTPAVWQKRN